MVGRQNSLEERLLGRPLVAYRLLCTAILANHCALLSSDWVQNVALIVLDEFRVVLNISNVVAVDLMYSSLRSPQTLQALTRRAVVTSLKGSPGDLSFKIAKNLPFQVLLSNRFPSHPPSRTSSSSVTWIQKQ